MSNEEKEAEFYQHLEELLLRARKALIAILVGMGIASVLPVKVNPGYETLVTYIIHRIEADLLPAKEVTLMAGQWTDVIMVYFYVSFLIGFLMASPIVAYEIYMYVAPALYPHEKKNLSLFVASFTVLFALGVLFSYFILLPWTYKFLIKFAYLVGASPFFTVENFLSFTLLVMIAVGLTFTFPVVTTLLVKLDIIAPETLTSRWREIIVAVFILAAIVTPDVSGFTMIILAAPILGLYVVAVVVAKAIYKKKDKR